MWALIVYCLYTVVFGMVAYEIARICELYTSDATSLMIFLALFFTNFVVSWWATVFTVERLEKKMAEQGAQAR